MPDTSVISAPARLCFKARTMGTAPATAASNSRSQPCSTARSSSSPPCSASRSLLAVTTFFPAFSASVTYVRAGSMPPISSMTMPISGSFKISSQRSVNRDGSAPSRFFPRLRTRIFFISRAAPVFFTISSFRRDSRAYTPLPTVP